MTAETRKSARDRFGLRDVPGTTLALASLAILGAAAAVGTPLWLWYRHKRKRADALLRQAVESPDAAETPEAESEVTAERNPAEAGSDKAARSG